VILSASVPHGPLHVLIDDTELEAWSVNQRCRRPTPGQQCLICVNIILLDCCQIAAIK
jgi:hypothetical protein